MSVSTPHQARPGTLAWRFACVFIALGFACAAGWWWVGTPHADALHPNILLITIDTLRADHLSCYGSRDLITPRLDALAARGVRFARAYSQSDRTSQSHMSMLVSRHLSEIIRPAAGTASYPTLAEALRDRGYRTAAVPASSLLNSDAWLTQTPRLLQFGLGFDDVYDLLPAETTDPAGQTVRTQRSGAQVNEIALRWLRARSMPWRRAPWFLWLHYYDVHGPDRIPAAFEPAGARPGSHAYYDASVRYVDSLVGQVLDAVAAAGMAETTAVVVTADHGEALGAHEFWGHSGLYDDIVRVPLIICLPDGPEGRTVERVVENVDIAPTLLRAPLPGMVGHSLRAFWAPREGSGSPASEGPTAGVAYAETRNLEARAVVRQGWKYIHYGASLCDADPRPWIDPAWFQRKCPDRPGEGIYREAGLRELFHLTDDPNETRNLGVTEPARVRSLSADLERRLGETPDQAIIRTMRRIGY